LSTVVKRIYDDDDDDDDDNYIPVLEQNVKVDLPQLGFSTLPTRDSDTQLSLAKHLLILVQAESSLNNNAVPCQRAISTISRYLSMTNGQRWNAARQIKMSTLRNTI